MKDTADNERTTTDSDPVIEAYKKHIDRTLLRENLKLTVDQRFKQLMELQRFAEELQKAGQRGSAEQFPPDHKNPAGYSPVLSALGIFKFPPA